MWIVRFALRSPYTFAVLAVLIALLGAVTIARMPADILPEIAIPIVSVVWTLPGLAPEDMADWVASVTQRIYSANVNGIEHMESQSMAGVAVIKVYFHPGTRTESAVAELTAMSQVSLRFLPPGITPPYIIRYSASTVPVLQLVVGSDTLPEEQLNDYAQYFIRTDLATVPGAAVPLPYGGKVRQVMVDLDPGALIAKGLSAMDVVQAVNVQNLVLPTGTAKMGPREYTVRLNGSPEALQALNDVPIKQVDGAMVYMRDVAHVHDGFAIQTNVVSENGRRASLLSVLRAGGASTLAVVDGVLAALPRIRATLPRELSITPLFDQSVFVRAALRGVIREAAIAAGLVGLIILVFLGSWRSTLIVATSIPLSLLASIIGLGALGHTLNLMTLGGLALAVGILVDDATVEIENQHRNLALGTPLRQALLDGAQQVALPAFVSTLSISIVFVPIAFLGGPAQFLFLPLALAVVLALLTSYVLSRTLVPAMAQTLFRGEARHQGRLHAAFERGFERFRDAYGRGLAWALGHRRLVLAAFVAFGALSLALVPHVGQDFFPRVDAGQFRLHVRAPAGTRIEETDQIFNAVERSIRRTLPPGEVALVLHNIGLALSGSNLTFSDGATTGNADGEILVALARERSRSTWASVKALRRQLRVEFPTLTFFFQPADIVGQVLNFGLPAPIDIQVVGQAAAANHAIARRIAERLRRVPGAADVYLHQVVAAPELRVHLDRTRAAQVGLSPLDVAQNLLVSLISSGQFAPNFWVNPRNGVSYRVAVQTPEHRVASVEAIERTSLPAPGLAAPTLLTNVARVERGSTLGVVNQYNIQPVFDVYANTEDRDLGGVAADIRRILAELRPELPPGSALGMRGQVESMDRAFAGLGWGLLFAILLVYCLMVVNFQSWLDPLIVIAALPGALSGIVWALFVTQTTFSVPSLMGAVMGLGVATANSILLVTFANQARHAGRDAAAAALAACRMRLRPVLMTALAMVIGMLPMSLGLSEGGEQNAPLARAVIGALLVATVATLFVVPVVYSLLSRRPPFPAEGDGQA
jgi:CzcA family heavy metal efflux pump